MVILEEDKLKLKHLLSHVSMEAERFKKDSIAEPVEEQYFKWIYDSPSYDSNGQLILGPGQGEYFKKKVWYTAAFLPKILAESDAVFKDTADYFIFKGFFKDGTRLLEYFIGRALHKYLYSSISDEELNTLIDNFLKELNGELLNCYADIELYGVNTIPERIDINSIISIRRTKVEDVAKELELSTISIHNSPAFYTPSCIIQIKVPTNDFNEIQKLCQKTVCLLMLFDVGSVVWSNINTRKDYVNLSLFGGKLSANKTIYTFNKYVLKDEDISRLKDFFEKFSKILPENMYWTHGVKQDDVLIAYKRYCAALLEEGTIEKRIANIIAGLEKIFIKADNIEVGYKLKVRVSRFFHFIGFNGIRVKKNILIGYDIRSIYAHGGVLTDEDKSKYAKEYIPLEDLYRELANYLRMSILMMLLSEYTSDMLIQNMEESLLDRKKEDNLIKKLSQWKSLLLGTNNLKL